MLPICKLERFGCRTLMPSCHITRPILVDTYTWVDAQDEGGHFKETMPTGSDVPFTGFVHIGGARRDSGGTGKIQLRLENYENPEEYPRTPIRLYHWNKEQEREEIIYLRESLKISENSLLVHWDHLREHIHDDPEALDRYEELRSSGFNPERNKLPEEQPPADKKEIFRQLVLASRKAGKKDAEIAAEIDKRYPGFSDADQIGRASCRERV